MYFVKVMFAFSVMSVFFLVSNSFFDESDKKIELESTYPFHLVFAQSYIKAYGEIELDGAEKIETILPPCAAAVNSDTNKVYVTSRLLSRVTVADGITNDILGTITVGENPCSIAVNQNTNMIYVVNENSNSLDIIDGSTNTVVNSLNLVDPYDVALNANTNMIYVTSDKTNTVYVIDGFFK